MYSRNLLPLLAIATLISLTAAASQSYAEEETKKSKDGDTTGSVEIAIDVQKAMGVTTQQPSVLDSAQSKVINGQIESIPANTADVNAPLAGRILTLLAQKGQHVSKGDPLIVVDTPEIRQLAVESSRTIAQNRLAEEQALAKLSLAKTNFEREKTLLELKVTAQKDYQAAESLLRQSEADLKAARAQLQLSNAMLKNRLAQLGQRIQATADGRVTLYSPLSGVISDQQVTPGESVEPARLLLKIVNTSQVWALAQVYEKDIQLVRIGQKIIVRTSAYPSLAFAAVIAAIDPEVDPVTRTIGVRALINNPKGLLKPQMFATIELVGATKDPSKALYLPSDALVTSSGKNAVFIKRDSTHFQLVPITVGETKDNYVRVSSGLAANDNVVTERAYQLLAETSKSSIPSDDDEKSDGKPATKPAFPLWLTLIIGLVLIMIAFFAGKLTGRGNKVTEGESVANDAPVSTAEKHTNA